jgi:hypothetical protein
MLNMTLQHGSWAQGKKLRFAPRRRAVSSWEHFLRDPVKLPAIRGIGCKMPACPKAGQAAFYPDTAVKG